MEVTGAGPATSAGTGEVEKEALESRRKGVGSGRGSRLCGGWEVEGRKRGDAEGKRGVTLVVVGK